MLRPFCTWMASRLSLTIGTNLFVGWCHVPRLTTTHSIVQARTPGLTNTDPAGYTQWPLQILTVSDTYNAAEVESNRITEALINLTGPLTVTGWQVASITGGPGGYIGQDEIERHTFSANLRVVLRKVR